MWLTDFVGWLPMPDGGEREAPLTADYNAEMIEQIARYPRVRDRAIFVGEPDDIVPDSFGAGLPAIRDWTEQHFDFAGYITGFDPASSQDRALALGYGGRRAGLHRHRRRLRRRRPPAAAGDRGFPQAKRARAGPADDRRRRAADRPGVSLPRARRARDPRPYVPDLYRHLAACDLAIVQGGLTTAMELTATRRPFLYFPLGHHFEQNLHVRHRLERYGAGRCMDFETSRRRTIAAAIAEEIGRDGRLPPGRDRRRRPRRRVLADLL